MELTRTKTRLHSGIIDEEMKAVTDRYLFEMLGSDREGNAAGLKFKLDLMMQDFNPPKI